MSQSFKEYWRVWDAKAHALSSKVLGIFGLLFVIYFVGAIFVGGFQELDKRGWIEHSANTSVSFKGDWLLGEYKNCFGSIDSMGTQILLECATEDGSSHMLPVTYWGRLKRPDRLQETDAYTKVSYGSIPLLSWKCQRLSESLKCWAED